MTPRQRVGRAVAVTCSVTASAVAIVTSGVQVRLTLDIVAFCAFLVIASFFAHWLIDETGPFGD